MSQSLADFIHAVAGTDLTAVEENLGEGFVRLKTAEAERRQAKHDIRSVEDIVVEMLRNSRDAHARNIYLATWKEGDLRSLVFLDDGDGIPQGMQKAIFEPRVTSKLDSMVMDRWGVHGRGMALYSIKSNTDCAWVVSSDSDLGASIRVDINLQNLTEKANQSTYPKLSRDENNELVVTRGPHNILRNIVEFSLEHRDSVNVYFGSPTDIVSRLYLDGGKRLSSDQLLFCDDVDDLPVCLRIASCGDAGELARTSASLGLPISERTAHRIIASQIPPAPSPLAKLTTERPAKSLDVMKDRRGLKIAKEDIEEFSAAAQETFKSLGSKYYLHLNGSPKVTVGKDAITVKFTIDKD